MFTCVRGQRFYPLFSEKCDSPKWHKHAVTLSLILFSPLSLNWTFFVNFSTQSSNCSRANSYFLLQPKTGLVNLPPTVRSVVKSPKPPRVTFESWTSGVPCRDIAGAFMLLKLSILELMSSTKFKVAYECLSTWVAKNSHRTWDGQSEWFTSA